MSPRGEAKRLFDAGYGIVSRRHRIASRCPPELAKGMDRCSVDQYRRVKSKESVRVTASVMRELLKLEKRGMYWQP